MIDQPPVPCVLPSGEAIKAVTIGEQLETHDAALGQVGFGNPGKPLQFRHGRVGVLWADPDGSPLGEFPSCVVERA